MVGRLQDKVAIVTGAGCATSGWGNGRAAAVIFAREGAHVFAVDHKAESMVKTLELAREIGGHEVRSHVCDVTRATDVAAMVAACLAVFGRIDILVNNVGGSAPGGATALTEEAWDSQITFNLKTVYLACKNVIPVMERAGGGSIVNIASTSGLRWTGAAQAAYGAAKAGVIQLTRLMAVEHAAKGIRVNAVIPGLLHTPMVENRLARQRAGGDVEALLAQRLARIPLGFMGDGRDTAHAALFLASEEARFITGTEIVVDGGMIARCD